MEITRKLSWVQYSIIGIWVCNCLLGWALAVREVWVPYMSASTDAYSHIKSDPFDGTSLPIVYIPDWTKVDNQDKSRRFEDISISDFLPIPTYNPLELLDEKNPSKDITLKRYTYFTPYMWSYRLNYLEHDGSHLWVDIRTPIGTPILSIANWVVIRAVEADSTGNKFVVIRHDNVPYEGKTRTLYSGYLHLSQILVTEGTKIRKGEILWRVGMTGIATTPHLHLQIDTADAPFHPYWPFNSADSRAKWLWFFDSVNAWLGKENALKYSIHPMVFIYTNLGGFSQANQTPTVGTSTPIQETETVDIASLNLSIEDACTKKRFSDVSPTSSLGRSLYELVDKKCLFQTWNTFNAKAAVTKREAMMNLMKFYGIEPANGTSHFLDVPIGDVFQWYAIAASRKWALDGNYAFPDKIITKEEFAELASKFSPVKNPSMMKIYNDVDTMNLSFKAIQDYGYTVGAKWGKFNPKSILTRTTMMQMFSSMNRSKRL